LQENGGKIYYEINKDLLYLGVYEGIIVS